MSRLRSPMGSEERPHGRSVMRQRVVSLLRQQIADGTLPLGSRLPIRSELEKKYRVSHVTMQRAIDELTSDGFVQSRGKLGTFVAESPSFVSTFALAFPFYPGKYEWTKFWAAIATEAAALQQLMPLKMPMYFNVLQDGNQNYVDFKSLVRDTEEHRIGGLIFASPPHFVMNTPLMQHRGVPRVSVGGEWSKLPGTWVVQLRLESFVDNALDYLASRGRKRLAVLSVPGLAPSQGQPEVYTPAASARGMIARQCWRQYVWQGTPECADNVVQLLMDGKAGDRPDALVIADDNLLEHAVAGMVKAGIRIGEDVDVVAHANFPLAGPTGYPVRRLGYRAGDVLNCCVDAIQRQRNGADEPQMLWVDAVWG